MNSKFKCPACSGVLSVASKTDGVMVWCRNARCTSDAAKEGAIADREQQAFEDLAIYVEAEQDALGEE